MEMLLMSYLAGTESITKKYLSKMDSNKIVFIPTAGNVEPYTGYIDEGVEMLKSLGYELEIIDISKYDEDYLKNKLSKTECICISGGNTFYLLQELKKKNLIGLLYERIKEGLFYIGESAGAIIMSENIEYSQMMDDKSIASELDDYTGVNVFNHYVLPHIGEYPFEESTQKILENYQDKISLVAINNSEAILVNDSGYTVVCESR
ncbi:Type 1 glutamine amidotransferase-like domain-containing protein [Veillonella parvula]|uniref:Type 1 glutamine amidotransferase-like domain-containing protein n=1 Tax=Veillonella parvula TaxID=29466 RepID=UPI001D091105|nr:Type 1 glutamine amidotransferase-like domain-containing protein [Veillonella parvula]MCB7451167.1 Type 1 glutamine amidotransferase-like domain-containing protein [Veillonella parvula]MCQ4955292.1 Type 1 glutamine amidotransferase-like domain-containing protein [Veillonella parvula]MCQ4976583.1 Type 1 glutamine amidotransferase-like domain-containing protein [Veillonella parvula]